MKSSKTELSNNRPEIGNLYLPLLAVAVLFNLFFSLWTSPYYEHWYSCDSALFALVGRGINMGMVPYRDFFDLKGPYLFFIEALGQLIHEDRPGVFILQIPFLWATLILIYKTSRLYLSKVKSAFVIAIFLFSHVSTIWGGNTIEEYMLPLNMLVIYLAVSFLKNHSLNTDNVPTQFPFIAGICFGIMLFAKATVASPLIGVCLALGILLVINKRFKELFKSILLFILGVGLAAVPPIVYFAYKGSLKEMFYCVFEFAFLRSVSHGDSFNIKWELQLTACIFAFLVGVLHLPIGKLKKPALPMEMCTLLISMSVVTYIFLHFGTPWIYYFMTPEAVLVTALIMLLSIYNPLVLFSSIKQAVCLITLFIYMIVFAVPDADVFDHMVNKGDYGFLQEQYYGANAIAGMIPQEERDSVYSFGMHMAFYEMTRIIPCCKYTDNLPFFIEIDPSIRDDVFDRFEKDPPKWLVISYDFESVLPEIYEMVMEKYENNFSNSVGMLYKLKQNGD